MTEPTNSSKNLKRACELISHLLIAVCVYFAWAEQFIWSIVCIAGILLFSNLPALLNKDGKKAKLDRELEKELRKL
ncbi:hypothetical protein A3742_06260 [Oleiphilus sp. HI0071]|uniref:hypothetical protein n=1 Tax=unclassified Oleiphilus TaxID=2631174 RepID=UPI0007C2ABBC|nr:MULTISPECIES: hypothetical protein [unclassified Oleiphilus]KZY62726.1 hypothetical protein A3737_19930 [Oleiphilus sp. HI0065]KZY79516.1 hypothetical protein A3742_21735 [Oleiphilus sp. HI0071]KZZ01750.1 hypothetical protein A3744_27995 [Oleiphilus sp. HI0073]KZZ52680.1 hypothetical protein A3760_10235 [Oleiphilus sp. HI0122]KZZ81097.1 hypothetical protein A3767_08615 [Oleiphilus sp. HI0133]